MKGLTQLLRGIAFAFLLYPSLTTQAFYDPNLGRFINRDPIGEEGGVNLYAFVENDPIDTIDLFGLQGVGICLRLSIEVGAKPPPIPRSAIESAIKGNKGRARVELPDGRKIDLFGKEHFEKATQQKVPTPHVHEPAPPRYQIRFKEWVRPADLKDIQDAISHLKANPSLPLVPNSGRNTPPQLRIPLNVPVPPEMKQQPQNKIPFGSVEA